MIIAPDLTLDRVHNAAQAAHLPPCGAGLVAERRGGARKVRDALFAAVRLRLDSLCPHAISKQQARNEMTLLVRNPIVTLGTTSSLCAHPSHSNGAERIVLDRGERGHLMNSCFAVSQ